MPREVSKRHKPTICCAIPTHEAGESLVLALQSIYKQSAFSEITEILLVLDGKPLVPNIAQQIRNSKLKIIHKTKREGQSAALNYIFKLSQCDILVITNDDVILDKRAVELLIEDKNIDLASGKAIPITENSFFSHILSFGYELTHTITKELKYDTYLSCNGRLLAVSKNLYKRIKIPDTVWNNDAFIYFFARLNGYSYTHSDKAHVLFRSPKNLNGYMQQNKKFQLSQNENEYHFKKKLDAYYSIPKRVVLQALTKMIVKSPVLTLSYLSLYLLSHLIPHSTTLPSSGIWDTDVTTKQ